MEWMEILLEIIKEKATIKTSRKWEDNINIDIKVIWCKDVERLEFKKQEFVLNSCQLFNKDHEVYTGVY
jgi:hypothetical protein